MKVRDDDDRMRGFKRQVEFDQIEIEGIFHSSSSDLFEISAEMSSDRLSDSTLHETDSPRHSTKSAQDSSTSIVFFESFSLVIL